jgi:hypothetical protein
MINNLILNHVFNKNFPYSLLLKSFFADRDCVTMIRPLTNED